MDFFLTKHTGHCQSSVDDTSMLIFVGSLIMATSSISRLCHHGALILELNCDAPMSLEKSVLAKYCVTLM